MGQAVCQVFGLPEALLKPTRLSDVHLKAPRPRRSCLASSKVERFLDIQVPTFAESLVNMRDHE
jgi:dTDP-4-dehydrorhamnose reductase